jgi:hypothetical protein
MSEPTLDQSQSRLLGALTLIALKHLGVDTLVVDEENSLCPDWRMARIGDVALLEKPADSRSPKRIDCYQVMERSVGATAFKFDPARLVYSLRRLHRAEPPVAQLSELDEDGRIEAQALAHHGACCI